ncbi:MAG TPA: T9SS type A sorting domain-containing protein [Arachidicoccus sp.]
MDLFPNPTSDFVHLQYEFPQSGKIQMVIYNSLGQQVSANYADQYNAGKKTFTIYTADLATGVYYVGAFFTTINGKQYSFNKKLEVIR